MRVKIKDLTELSEKIIQKWGFSDEEAKFITENFIDGELTGKKTHGLVRLLWMKKQLDGEKISNKKEELEIVKETPVSILVDGKNKPGVYVINKALEFGLEKVKKSGMVAVGCTNTAPVSGMIGSYARKAAEQNLIFIGFNNSSGGLVPHGATKELWGTNPMTVGIPTNNFSVILDMASSKITWGGLLLAKAEGKKLPGNVAVDKDGNITTDPNLAVEGGLLTFAEHKGSGLAFIVELLGGALTKSRVGTAIKGGWGSFFILIDPALFRDVKEFKNEVETAIKELKSLPKAKGVEEIFYPGEQSQKLREENLKTGEIEISDDLYSQIKELSERFYQSLRSFQNDGDSVIII